MRKREKISYPTMPLAIYREVAAHLEQVSEVRVDILVQSARAFAYEQSQVEGLLVDYPQQHSSDMPVSGFDRQKQIDAILSYYADRYSQWERTDWTE